MQSSRVKSAAITLREESSKDITIQSSGSMLLMTRGGGKTFRMAPGSMPKVSDTKCFVHSTSYIVQKAGHRSSVIGKGRERERARTRARNLKALTTACPELVEGKTQRAPLEKLSALTPYF